MPDAILTIGGQQYGGWKSIRVGLGIEQISGAFSLSLSERWPGQETGRPVRPGQACAVALDGETVITGHVDDVRPGYTAASHDVTIEGRDRAGDLVDCSVVHSGEWRGRTLPQVAEAICKPFGIRVRTDIPHGPVFRAATAQPGETAFEALERAARMRGALLVSDGLGGLVITRASKQRIATALVRGGNILEAQAALSWRERHSRYIVIGDEPGDDWSTPEQNARPKGEVRDPVVDRYRPLVLLAEHPGGSQALAERARWEASVRMGRAARAEVTVQGWRHADGLWRPNLLVPVQDDWLQLERDMLIAGVTYLYDDRGSRTQLDLVRPEMFTGLAVPEPEEDDLGWE